MHEALVYLSAISYGIFSFGLFSTMYYCLQVRGTPKDVMMSTSYLFSTIHSAIVGFVGLKYFIANGMDAMCGDPKWIWFTIGYLLADECWIAWRYSPLSISLHHLIGGTGLFIIATQNYGYGYGMYFLATEISTVPLNIAWHMRKCNHQREYLLPVYATTLVTYMFIRIIPGPYFVYSTIMRYITGDGNIITALAPVIGCTIVGLNFYWFVRLIQSSMKEDRPSKQRILNQIKIQ